MRMASTGKEEVSFSETCDQLAFLCACRAIEVPSSSSLAAVARILAIRRLIQLPPGPNRLLRLLPPQTEVLAALQEDAIARTLLAEHSAK